MERSNLEGTNSMTEYKFKVYAHGPSSEERYSDVAFQLGLVDDEDEDWTVAQKKIEDEISPELSQFIHGLKHLEIAIHFSYNTETNEFNCLGMEETE